MSIVLGIIHRVVRPVALGGLPELVLAVPRVVAGLLLASEFGASKFGLPWSPSDKELGLFEVASWFPEDVAQFGGPFALFPWFFAWMGAASEALGGLSMVLGAGRFSLDALLSAWLERESDDPGPSSCDAEAA